MVVKYTSALKTYLVLALILFLAIVLFLSTKSAYAHSGSTTKAAWDVCQNKSKSESCEYTGFHDKIYRGTCQSISANMMCVRNQPIITKKKSASTTQGESNSKQNSKGNTVEIAAVNPSLFIVGALEGEVKIVDCTLSGGTKTTCYRMTIVGSPADPETSPEGPFCPPSITSSADQGGTWIDGKGTIYPVDGKFIENLATLYKDKEWQMYDIKTGKVTIITGTRGCEIAGDPRPVPGLKNFCLECPLRNLNGGVKKTVLIPTIPVPAKQSTDIRGRGNIGVALNGVLLGPPAPLEMILSTHTLGVLDQCGAHTNPHEGYHYHAANGCAEIGIQKDGHSPMIGYALDGYAIYAKTDKSTIEAKGLDECGGETDNVRGYHYHASAPGKNQIFSCFKGEQGSFEGERRPGGPEGRSRGPRPEHGGPRPKRGDKFQ